ncbi:apolipoprotein N-acyltransferase [Planctomonas deserti]|uniref:apolipoprotein N-acyltransferase n=1 Tax=Planctomonas deserti TaxID=2144185 RepID=UPI000D392E7F|nr:apolipoprotein N-acyltransferase [Planctomonas deserti]
MALSTSPRAVPAPPAAGRSRPHVRDRGQRLPLTGVDRVDGGRASVPLWLSLLLAVASGPISAAGFPDQGVWPLTLVGVGAFLAALVGRAGWSAAAVGLVGGLAFYLTHISWLTVYLGPVPWAALSGLESLFWAAFAVPIAVVLNRGPRLWTGAVSRHLVLPAAVAALWTAREAVTSTWPYGGFAWGRVALSQSESPFAPLVAWVGVSGLSFLLVALVALVLQLARQAGRPVLPRLTAGVAALAVLLLVPAWPAPTTGSTTVAAVQGNTNSGLLAEYLPGENLQKHLDATAPLVGQDVDMVVWPENGSDLDPSRSAAVARAVDRISSAMDAPLVLGTVTQAGEDTYNSSLLWLPGQGVGDQYDKKHPVPFAEYAPDREFWRAFAPDLIDMVPRGYSKGTRDTVLDVGGVIAGISICFDITDDALVREMTGDGAEIILAQTNNADFGQTEENVQQLAIARLRAIEIGRSVVNISTVGTSAIIAPDGSTISRLTPYEPGSMVESVPLATAVTPASLVGAGLELAISGFGIAALLAVLLFGRRRA